MTTEGFRGGERGKKGFEFDLRPEYFTNPDEKAKDQFFTFPGIERYNPGDAVGIQLQVEDATGQAIDVDPDNGMENNTNGHGGASWARLEVPLAGC